MPGVHLSDLSGGSDSSLGDLMLISCAMIDAWLAYLLQLRVRVTVPTATDPPLT